MRKVKLHIGSVALIFGVVIALLHLVWSLMVFTGIAGWYLGWILGLHFLSNPYKVQAFSWSKAGLLVLFTFVVGYVFGWVFAFIWNRLHKK